MQPSVSTFRRFATWLGLALLLAASTPHLHSGEHLESGRSTAGPAASERSASGGLVEDAAVSADENHDEHLPRPSIESRPCSLCRTSRDHPIDRTRPGVRIYALERSPVVGKPAAVALAASFASLHPTRAPPPLRPA